MNSLMYAGSMSQDVAQWGRQVVLSCAVLVWSGMLVRASILERRYKGPYTLLAASFEEKWRWAVELAFWETGGIFLMVLGMPVRSSDPNQWWSWWSVICGGGLWVAGFVLAVLIKRWDLGRTLARYHRWDEAARRGQLKQTVFYPLVEWFGGEELQRFYKEGYGADDCQTMPGRR